MIVALIDNGSLEPAAQLNLRAVAAELSQRGGVQVHAVSWKHSDRIPPDSLGGLRAWTVAAFVRSMVALGHHEYLFIPFFISGRGAIASSLRRDLAQIETELATPLAINFTAGLADRGALAAIVAERVREVVSAQRLARPAVVVVDHGGPASNSAELRDRVARQVTSLLRDSVGPVGAASMEGVDHPHNHPLLATQLATPGFDRGAVVIAPLFLSPGRHAGARGDLARIAAAAEDRTATAPLRCHFTGLVGTHPRAVDELTAALRDALHSRISASSPDLQPETLA